MGKKMILVNNLPQDVQEWLDENFSEIFLRKEGGE
jgi:hypothetical protein